MKFKTVKHYENTLKKFVRLNFDREIILESDLVCEVIRYFFATSSKKGSAGYQFVVWTMYYCDDYSDFSTLLQMVISATTWRKVDEIVFALTSIEEELKEAF